MSDWCPGCSSSQRHHHRKRRCWNRWSSRRHHRRSSRHQRHHHLMSASSSPTCRHYRHRRWCQLLLRSIPWCHHRSLRRCHPPPSLHRHRHCRSSWPRRRRLLQRLQCWRPFLSLPQRHPHHRFRSRRHYRRRRRHQRLPVRPWPRTRCRRGRAPMHHHRSRRFRPELRCLRWWCLHRRSRLRGSHSRRSWPTWRQR